MAYGGAYGLDLSSGGGIPADLDALFDQTKSLAARPRTITELPGGLTNRNYKVSAGGEAYVLRIAGAGTHHYIDRAAEARNAGLAAAIGIAPELLYLDPESGLMLTRFIAGSVPLRAADLRRPELLRSAVGLLKRLHGSGRVFSGRMNLFPKLDEYIALAAQEG